MINTLIKRAILPLAILFFAGCQKEAIQLPENNSEEITASKGSSSGGCRMTLYDYYNSFDDYHDLYYFTYKNGLVDEATAFGYTFKMEYDANKKLKFSSVYNGADFLYTMQFIYKNKQVIKEIWYVGNTKVVDDETFYTYNRKGEMLRNESFLYDYFVDYTYYADGALKSYFYYSGGLPVQKAEYTYKGAHKNPYLAVPGMDHYFVTSVPGFGMGFGEKWYTSEKITLYDSNGDPFVDYEQDPKKTEWELGQQDYPQIVNYIDKWGEGLIVNSFDYENCNPGHEHHSANKKQNSIGTNEGHAKAFRGLMHGLSKNTIEKLRTENLNKKAN